MFAQSTPHAQENQVAVVTMGDTGLLGMLVPHKAAQRAVSKPPAKKARKARSSAPDGVHLVIHVCAPGAMVDFLPDEGCYDSAGARDALMASCPLHHGLPLSDVLSERFPLMCCWGAFVNVERSVHAIQI